ncbi:MAG: hypothetical protein ACT4O1_18130 [Gemmatimonadota bacterium]
MEYRISATELARRLGDVLGRIRYRHDVFTVERNGAPVAVIGPAPGARPGTLHEALAAWMRLGPDPEFAADLERVARADAVPANPWES